MKETTTQQLKRVPANRFEEGEVLPPVSRVARLRHLARLLDEAIRVPGTQRRIGLESLLGLIPGLGDVLGGLLAVYGLLVAVQVGVPRAVLLQMFFNIGLDTVTGAVPLVGDLFDFAWKANSRNLALLVRYLESPTETHAASRRLLVALLALLFVLCGLAFWLATVSVRTLLHWFS